MRDLIRFRVGLLLSLLFVLFAWSSGRDGNVQAKTYKKGFAYHKISSEMKSQMSVMAEDIVSIKLKNDSVDTTLISHTYEINRLRKAK